MVEEEEEDEEEEVLFRCLVDLDPELDPDLEARLKGGERGVMRPSASLSSLSVLDRSVDRSI